LTPTLIDAAMHFAPAESEKSALSPVTVSRMFVSPEMKCFSQFLQARQIFGIFPAFIRRFSLL
jgi:hypothetical protein